MHTLETTIDIDAPPAVVWRVLSEFERYPEWNEYVRIEGTPVAGARLTVTPGPRAGRQPSATSRVLRAEPEYELRWRSHLLVRGLCDGEHCFTIENLGNGRSRLTQAERFVGLLAGPFVRRYGRQTAATFEGVNRAIKRRAETTARTRPTTTPRAP
ncbi:SRPBCC family protein [Halorientalis brevis]|uniref:SRPBCC family protein n=1 Tax=Halorientalis brevis TaxID=1126241 RepID=A0ABD6C708_9EURY|nr:SRPBCC domain-containing protein [Halorientalis brevis]